MPVFPQMGTGALSQFPVRKQRRLRTVKNTSLDGRSIKLADAPGEVTEWQLNYANLTDDEVAAIEQFFAAVEGTLNEFTFVDPTDNLIAESDHLDNVVWQVAPLLLIVSGIADPTGGTNGWHLANSGGAAQAINQTLSAPSGYLYCFSAYVRSQSTTTLTMLAGSQRFSSGITSEWTRIELAARGDVSGTSISFGLELPAGESVDVYGMQVEPQASASLYKPSRKGGVYEGARLSEDLLTITTTGVNCHSCTVNIIHANHL
jgi:hypothetical protein